MFVQQLGLDGKTTIKAFAPGYGEFLAHSEDAAVAVPTDALSQPLSAELKTMLNSAVNIVDAPSSENWDSTTVALDSLTTAWEAEQ
jgi:hypothetical protein